MEQFNRMKTTAILVGTEAVMATSKDVLTNQRRLGRRHTLEIYNKSDQAVLFGGEDLTLENGMPIMPNERRTFPTENADAVYLIAETPAEVVIAEYCS